MSTASCLPVSVPLRTARLVLEPCRPSDRDDFIALETDPQLMRYLHGGAVDHAVTHPGTAPFLMPRGTEPYVWTARRLTDRGFIGWFSLVPKSQRLAELGYRLRLKQWSRGFATEGASALLRWGIEQAGYHRVTASTMAVNLGSRRVLEKIGMTYSFTDFSPYPNPIPGSEHGEAWYELLSARSPE